jgi:hypothetical protein
LERGSSIGANATLCPGVVIGEGAMVGAGAVVTYNVPPYAKVAGNPARIIGYVGTATEPAADSVSAAASSTARVPSFQDLRGNISAGEVLREIPFEVKRYFVVYGVASEKIRGEHAHRTLHQFLVCVAGKCHVVTDDGCRRTEVLLDSPAKGLHLPPMTWATQYKFSPDAVLLVLASEYYDANEYIRDYTEFLRLSGSPGAEQFARSAKITA